MMPATAYKQALRACSVGILAVFAFGSVSGPLRTCLSHPAHAGGAHGGSDSSALHGAMHDAGTPKDHGPATDHEGCSCLGRCSLENPPSLPGALAPTLAHAPDAPRALVAASVRVFTGHDLFDLPLARPPPAVV
jgi:hypothetical protein